jgi:probable HAF family extracellular repeat protein
MRVDWFTSAACCSLGAIATCLAATVFVNTFAAQPCGGMQDLGTLGGSAAEAIGVSADGSVVVGWASNAAGPVRAFRWTAAGGMQDLGSMGAAGTNAYIAYGVSADGGVVVGREYNLASQIFRAFRWTAGGGMQDLGTLGGLEAFAKGVSANGSVVVGWASNAGGWTRAFRWTATGGMQDLGTLGGTSASAWGVSADGSVVVGWAINAGGQLRAFRWTAAGGMQDLRTLGGNGSAAHAVSADGGVVVGDAYNAAGYWHAFRWTAAGGMQDLGTLGGDFSVAWGVSADGGVVVGDARNAAGYSRAFRWTAAGGMQDLGTLGGDYSEAYAVSADGGVVVGDARNAAGYSRAFRWTAAGFQRTDTRQAENESLHSTARYGKSSSGKEQLVIRRGEKPLMGPTFGTIDVDVTVSDCLFSSGASLSFQATNRFGGVSRTQDLPVSDVPVPADEWGCQLLFWVPLSETGGKHVARMRITIPADAAIGEYNFAAVAKDASGATVDTMPFADPVVVLFNPWDPNDATYMANPAEREEYVLTESGLMWQGTARSPEVTPWNYAQFEPVTLETTLKLLGESRADGHPNGLTEAERSDPAVVARWLTERIDGTTDAGVLVGRWSLFIDPSATYAWSWRSSAEIFAKYLAAGKVKYGQCWNFGGLLTSSLRTLGIPARPITNFESGHDRSRPYQNVDVCQYVDSFYREQTTADSGDVWTFHVWCEAWMSRPGLAGMDGWQVFDATPQEQFGGLFQLGPVPVAAVKAGNRLNDEVDFVRAEVDADIVFRPTLLDANNNRVCNTAIVQQGNSTDIGRRITTKSVGASGGVDITSSYKTPETSPLSDVSPFGPPNPQPLELLAPPDSAVGSDLIATAVLRNIGAQVDEFKCHFVAVAVSQDGTEVGDLIPVRTTTVSVAPGATSAVPIDLTWAEVQPALAATDLIRLGVVMQRMSDGQVWFDRSIVRIRGLPISLSLLSGSRLVVDGTTTATIGFTNPLPTPLTNVRLDLGGDAGLLIDGTTATEAVELGTIAPGASTTVTRSVLGAFEGSRLFMARISADGVLPSDMFVDVLVFKCTGDLNADGLVDDADFSIFVVAYDTLDCADPAMPLLCPADLNRDGVVDDADFSIFVVAYDKVICE